MLIRFSERQQFSSSKQCVLKYRGAAYQPALGDLELGLSELLLELLNLPTLSKELLLLVTKEEFSGEQLFGRGSFRRIRVHHFGDVPFELGMSALELIKLVVSDVVPFVTTSRELTAETDAVHRGAERENIAPRSVNGVKGEHLSCHVTVVALVSITCVDGVCQSEVAELEFVVLDEDIVWLYIEVDEVVGVNDIEGKAHLAQKLEESVSVVLRETSLLDFLDQGVIAELHLNKEALGLITATAFDPAMMVSDDMERSTTRAV